jgi:hypothetical protein
VFQQPFEKIFFTVEAHHQRNLGHKEKVGC